MNLKLIKEKLNSYYIYWLLDGPPDADLVENAERDILWLIAKVEQLQRENMIIKYGRHECEVKNNRLYIDGKDCYAFMQEPTEEAIIYLVRRKLLDNLDIIKLEDNTIYLIEIFGSHDFWGADIEHSTIGLEADEDADINCSDYLELIDGYWQVTEEFFVEN